MQATQRAANRLAESTKARLVDLWTLHQAGRITLERFRVLAAAAVAQANTAGVQLADLGLAADLTRQLGRPTPPLGLRPTGIQVDQQRIASDIDRIVSRIDEPVDELGRWAASEPLLTVANTVQAAMAQRGVERWVRVLSGTSCTLCTGWADGVARPVGTRMARHPGCDCIQQPVLT